MTVRCTINHHIIHHHHLPLAHLPPVGERWRRSITTTTTTHSTNSLSSSNPNSKRCCCCCGCYCCCWWYRLEYELEEEEKDVNATTNHNATSHQPMIMFSTALYKVSSAQRSLSGWIITSSNQSTIHIVPTYHWRRCILQSVFASPLGEAAFIYYYYTAINLS